MRHSDIRTTRYAQETAEGQRDAVGLLPDLTIKATGTRNNMETVDPLRLTVELAQCSFSWYRCESLALILPQETHL